jgi:hypothetical protein
MIQNIEYYDKNMRDIIRYTNHDIIDTDYFQVSSLHLIEKYIINNQNIDTKNIEDNKNDKIKLFNIIIEKMNINKKMNLIFMVITLIIYYYSYFNFN